MVAISSDSLSKTYTSFLPSSQHIKALDSFSLKVNQGEIFGLLGPNGAGKTTFIKILLSITRPTSGRVEILGTRLPDVSIRKQIGYLPENHRFPGYLTGEQTLRFFGQLGGSSLTEISNRIQPLLRLVGMEQWSSTKVAKYSKGMMQRLGLAQALINDPKIIFLDEPTDGIDPVGRKEIRDILKNLRDQGKTIFLNSHLLSEVELVSDRVAILNKGKLLRVGTVTELTASEDLYEIGFEGLLPADFRSEIEAMVLKIQIKENLILAELSSVSELNILIDLIRKHNGSITSVVRKKTSLEDSFLSLLKREEKS